MLISFAILPATAYGQGVYFADRFEYSAKDVYSSHDEDGSKYIFQCKVLTVEYAAGKPEYVQPPVKA